MMGPALCCNWRVTKGKDAAVLATVASVQARASRASSLQLVILNTSAATPCAASSAAAWLRPVIHPVYARLLCAWVLRHGFTREQALEGTLPQWDTLHQGSEFLSLAQVQRLVARALA